MNNFTYCNPVRLIYGKGATAEIEKQHLIPEGARVMMTYGGGSIKKNGVYEEVLKYVKPICEFGGIEPNPTHETCTKAVALAKENNINFLLAVGGGSVVDGTKYIALAMEHTFSDDTYDILLKASQFKVNPAKAKIGVVLTLPATGSEMNNGFVLSRKADNMKLANHDFSLYPTFSIVDPCHTMSLPLNQVRNGITDSFVHVYEQYIGHYQMNAVTDAESEGVFKVIMNVAKTTMDDVHNYKARADFCYAATVALNYTLAVGIKECWAAHMIGHELTAYYGVAHGESLAMTTEGVMRFNKEKNAQKLIQMAENVYGIKNAKPEDAIEATEKFFKSIGNKTRLSEWGFGKEHFEEIAQKFKENACGAHDDIDDVAVMKILNDIY
ncbi:alcohol dehydrogenase, putative [Entamoeba invadens IP1]|uniref:Alcohol dehydrogenase, putative n=2 Tax=Entamoeba invadens TaxID=33085 RepID=A0A0A1U224_ENTIV|nr:alcohol dehydrogenase, putative [Entamoeba invadens IP1]BAN40450.1 alcohol dehydrogenase, putative [Entamoeba invadens]ELP88116.1 alcohol dehydrogenase, putative [Entamoeba invadens IP1]BAN40706.1 alcohol dehydrogenase, putative [Entamoeba invadens]BAN41296.1 alcohol dehydrogenase, putative [Entamoeba invadens]BAN42491.1 alcohol dehydrogenase, putative [Entamoeba invadens]|eukprot:XP_004254887.1 alcohol dehydrogenase, putative [Entamoeba invadens IP1]